MRDVSANASRSAGMLENQPQAAGDCSLGTLQERLATADPDAFESIFRRLSEPVFRYVRRMVPDEAQAHDITQDTFAKLWSMHERLSSVDSLRAYVFRMARNRVYNQQREERTRRNSRAQIREKAPPPSSPAPDQALDANLLRKRIDGWIQELPDRQREAFTLRRQQELSHDAIAAIMDISPSTVNNHIVRALKHLRNRLHEYRPDLLSS